MRLTKQIDLEELGYDYVLIDGTNQPSANYKLGQLEDIEEELGIDLLTLFKALTDTIAIKNKDESIEEMWACPRFQISIDKSDSWILYGPVEEQNYVSIKDYGKTWALSKEELE